MMMMMVVMVLMIIRAGWFARSAHYPNFSFFMILITTNDNVNNYNEDDDVNKRCNCARQERWYQLDYNCPRRMISIIQVQLSNPRQVPSLTLECQSLRRLRWALCLLCNQSDFLKDDGLYEDTLTNTKYLSKCQVTHMYCTYMYKQKTWPALKKAQEYSCQYHNWTAQCPVHIIT